MPSQITLEGTPELIINIRSNRRARRLSLRISPDGSNISATLPPNIPLKRLHEFIKEKEGWLRKAHSETIPPLAVEFGALFPFEGKEYRLCQGAPSRPAITREERRLIIGGEGGQMRARLRAYLKATAHAHLLFASEKYATKLGRQFSALTLRDPRTRWGSCSSAGRLMYSWRLIMAPPHVLDYVVAHEVAHLEYMNHSKRFWDRLATLLPNYQEGRRWLREEGASLQRWQFTLDAGREKPKEEA